MRLFNIHVKWLLYKHSSLGCNKDWSVNSVNTGDECVVDAGHVNSCNIILYWIENVWVVQIKQVQFITLFVCLYGV